MTGSPVIIPMMTWHEGVPAMLESLKLYSPDNPVVVIGGEETRKHIDCIPVELCSSSWPQFENSYVHHSSNPVEYDLACFRRWFTIWDYTRKLKIKSFWNFDWDTLIFCNLAEEEKRMTGINFTAPLNYFFCRDYDMYVQWMLFLLRTYDDKSKLAKFVDRRNAGDWAFHEISDMTLAWEFQRRKGLFSLDQIQENPRRCFDNNITVGDDSLGKWEMENGLKKLTWLEHSPVGIRDDKLTKLCSLHFWSDRKSLILEFLAEAVKSKQ